jgi:hypothetical protein
MRFCDLYHPDDFLVRNLLLIVGGYLMNVIPNKEIIWIVHPEGVPACRLRQQSGSLPA